MKWCFCLKHDITLYKTAFLCNFDCYWIFCKNLKYRCEKKLLLSTYGLSDKIILTVSDIQMSIVCLKFQFTRIFESEVIFHSVLQSGTYFSLYPFFKFRPTNIQNYQKLFRCFYQTAICHLLMFDFMMISRENLNYLFSAFNAYLVPLISAYQWSFPASSFHVVKRDLSSQMKILRLNFLSISN